MLRRFVICTPYLRSDTTRAALRLADMLRLAGMEVAIGVTSQKVEALHPHWDKQLLRNPWRIAYGPEDSQIWFVPPPSQARDIASSLEIPYYVVHNENFNHEVESSVYADARYIICPDVGSYWRFSKLKGTGQNARLVQWDIGGVPCRNGTEQRVRSLLLPLHDMYHRQLHPGCVYAIAAVAKQYELVLTLTLPRRLPTPFHRSIKDLKKKYPLVQTVQVLDELLERDIMSAADCVVWPGISDAFGTVTQSSLYAGTPVLSWFESPHVDLISHMSNGVLVDREEDFRISLMKFLVRLRLLVQNWDGVAIMRNTAHDGLVARQADFTIRWLELLEV